jgi:hypothetical protein
MFARQSQIQIWGGSTVGIYVVNRRASCGVKEHTFGMCAHMQGVVATPEQWVCMQQTCVHLVHSPDLLVQTSIPLVESVTPLVHA